MNHDLFVICVLLVSIVGISFKSLASVIDLPALLAFLVSLIPLVYSFCYSGFFVEVIMGVCCTKEANFVPIPAREGGEAGANEDQQQQQHDVRKGDFGASVRVSGSSTFVSMATQQGMKGVNQDAMTVWEDFVGEKEVFFCGVFDGHGPCGHKVSRRVRDSLPSKLATSYKARQRRAATTDALHPLDEEDEDAEEEDGPGTARGGAGTKASPNGQYYEGSVFNSWKASFLRAFKDMDKDLTYDPSIDSYCSGTTAVTVVRQGEHLVIGNLGDSRAVLCTRGDKGQVVPIQLTVDLKPSLPREAERIMHCSGRVFALDEESDVLRVWQPEEDTPGLAMSRAFGDFCLKDYGLISIPQLFYRKLTERDEFVVLASDGVWDVLTNLEVVKIVASARKRSLAAKLLITFAVRAWKSRFPNSRVDDIAVVCFFFKHPLPPVRSTSELSHITPDSLSHLNSSSLSVYSKRSSLSSDDDDGFEFWEKTKIRDDEPEEWSMLEGAGGEELGGDATPQTVLSRRRPAHLRE